MDQPDNSITAGSLKFRSVSLMLILCVIGTTPGFAQQHPSQTAAQAARTESGVFYDPKTIQVVHLTIADSELERMRAALPERIYVPATFRWRDQTIENVGVRYKGNSSSHPNQPYKRSFLIKFSEFKKQQSFLGLQRIALDNGIQFGSVFSEQLITQTMRDLGLKASRCNFARLYLNDKYHGVYVNVERIDSSFLKHNFADGSGALYKADEGGPGSNLEPFPAEAVPGGRIGFEPKSDAAKPKAADVRELIAKINQTPAVDFAKVMESTMELDDFLKTMAVMLYSGAFDQYTGWQPHNYYLYHEPASNKWTYIPWDLDVGFADNAFRRIPVLDQWNAAWPVPGGPTRPLIERIVDDPILLARYRETADAILEKYFHPDVLSPKLDELYLRIKSDLQDDPFPHVRITNPEDRDYDSIVASIKQFIRKRYDSARAQLDQPGPRPKIVRQQQNHGQPRPGKSKEGAPTELRVASQTASSVKLQWKDNALGEVAHVVQRAAGETGGEFQNYIGKPGANVSTATDPGVAAGQTYRYRVYAVHPTPFGPLGTAVSNEIRVTVVK